MQRRARPPAEQASKLGAQQLEQGVQKQLSQAMMRAIGCTGVDRRVTEAPMPPVYRW